MGFLQGAEDVTRIILNSASGNLPTMVGSAEQKKWNADQLAAARQRMGLAGDVVNAASMLAGGAGVIKGAAAGIRALPGMARAVSTAARGAGPAAIRAVNPAYVGNSTARARLGLDALPGMGQRAASVVRANPKKSLAFGVGTGLGAVLGYDGRNGGAANASVAPTVVAPVPTATPAPVSDGGYDPLPPGIREAAAADAAAASDPFQTMVEQIAAANGGKISMREMMAIADITNKTASSRKAPKLPSIADVAGQQALSIAQQRLSRAEASGDPELYESELENFNRVALALSRVSPTDQAVLDSLNFENK